MPDFIEWLGGPNPVPGQWVIVLLRNGTVSIPCRADDIEWQYADVDASLSFRKEHEIVGYAPTDAPGA